MRALLDVREVAAEEGMPLYDILLASLRNGETDLERVAAYLFCGLLSRPAVLRVGVACPLVGATDEDGP